MEENLAVDRSKVCRKCGVSKILTEFYKSKLTSDGRGSWCKQCEKARAAGRAAESREYNKSAAGKEAARKYRATKEYKEASKAAARARRAVDPVRARAREAVNYAIRTGRLVRPATCEQCGLDCTPHGHHTDYGKPLVVVWLCHDCHGKEHQKYPLLGVMP